MTTFVARKIETVFSGHITLFRIFAMTSMYDTIMFLPLFKGVTEEDVSVFLEKTRLVFDNYNAGDVIIDKGEVVERLGFVVSGKVNVEMPLSGGKVIVRQTLGRGFWLEPESLFGYIRESRSRIVSNGKSGVLWLTRGQLFDVLEDNCLCRLNLMNYLCYRAQCRQLTAEYATEGRELERWLAIVLANTTERRAQTLRIEVEISVLAGILGLGESEVRAQILSLTRRKDLRYVKGVFNIYNRRDYF